MVMAAMGFSGLLMFAQPAVWAQETTPSPSQDWKAISEQAAALFAAGDAAGAVSEFRRALAAADAIQPRDEAAAMHARLALSSALLQAGQFDEGKSLAVEAHAIAEQRLRAAQNELATTLKFLGTVHMVQGQTADAETALQRAVELSIQANGEVHAETAKHLGNMGSLYLQQTKMDDARAAFQRSLAIWDQVSEPHPIYHSGALANLATLQLQLGETEEGLASFAKGLEILEQSLGNADPRLHQYLQRYAKALETAGQPDQAKALRDRLPPQEPSSDK
jgi:tetratricopeptide (TPR) repeat protein